MYATNDPLVVWPVYEPASQRQIALDAEALVQHVLILGSTGCGKSTLLTSAAQQLIGHRPQRIGLLVLDAKQDGTVERVTEAARAAGRGGDLAILGPQGTHVLGIFGRLRSYEDVDTVTQWLLLASDKVGGDNPFWQNSTASMISAALTLLLVRRKLPLTYSAAVEFMRAWFFGLDFSAGLPKPVADAVGRAKRECSKPAPSPQLLGALDCVELWTRLDPRTKSNLQSCIFNFLRPLMSAAANRCFEANDRQEFDPAEVAKGRLAVVSVNALTHPDLAKFFLRLARRLFFDAVQARQGGPHPLTGLLADEFGLILQPEDAEELATLRSRSCFVLSATQGISAMQEKIGPRLCQSVLLNFNTMVFMRSREPQTGELATLSLGQQEPRVRSRRTDTWEDSMTALVVGSRSEPRPVWNCPPGALGRLQPHQGYVVAADGSSTGTPVWFVPWFESTTERASSWPHQGAAARYVENLMTRWCGLDALLPPELVLAAVRLDEHRRDTALQRAEEFFRSKACLIPKGLDLLPACWLAGLPGILWGTRQPHWTHLPYMISRLEFVEGVLVLTFEQEQSPDDDQLTLWDELRVTVNRNLYPSRWRRLMRRHRMLLLFARPDLRSALEAGPVETF